MSDEATDDQAEKPAGTSENQEGVTESGAAKDEDEEGQVSPPEDLEEDPAYSFDKPEAKYKGG
jgi:hypothetical protein